MNEASVSHLNMIGPLHVRKVDIKQQPHCDLVQPKVRCNSPERTLKMTINFQEMLWKCEVDAEIIRLQSKKLIANKEYWLATVDDIERHAGSPALTKTQFKDWLERIQKEPANDEYY